MTFNSIDVGAEIFSAHSGSDLAHIINDFLNIRNLTIVKTEFSTSISTGPSGDLYEFFSVIIWFNLSKRRFK